MKTIFIGDIHGRDIWKDIVSQEKPDRVIFIGDYFDSFDIKGPAQIDNFRDIIAFKESGQCEVIMLIGNHCYHYMRYKGVTDEYSGYQHRYNLQIGHLLEVNEKHLQMAYQFEDFLCTHAGVSVEWLALNGYVEIEKDNIADIVNGIFKENPLRFNFNGIDPYGDNTYQTPIWIRPISLISANRNNLEKEVVQVVGHTTVKIDIIEHELTNGRYHFIDKLHNKHGQFLIYEDGATSVGEIKRDTTKS
jgi:predicted MPP superfamily phosphohydrolase